jgi:hypothetical protein
LSLGPKSINTLISPKQKICTHSSLCTIRLFCTRRIGTSLLASSMVMHYLPGSPRPEMRQSTLTSFPAIGTSLYRLSLIVTLRTQSSNSRDPMCRDADNSRSRSLETSLLARSSDSCLDSRCPRLRYLVSAVTSPRCDPHFPRSHRNVASHPLATSVAKSSAPFSRTPDMPIHESNYTPRDPDQHSCPPELRTFSTLALWFPCTSARSHASDSRDFSLENSNGPFQLQLKQALIPRSPVQLHASFQHFLKHFQHNPSVQSFDEFKSLSLLSFDDFKSLRKNSCMHPLWQIVNHD